LLQLREQQSLARRHDCPSGMHAAWQPGYAVMALKILYFSRDPSLSRFLVSTLEEKTGQRFGRDIGRWYEWLWSRRMAGSSSGCPLSEPSGSAGSRRFRIPGSSGSGLRSGARTNEVTRGSI
jgi:hypothetical protein